MQFIDMIKNITEAAKIRLESEAAEEAKKKASDQLETDKRHKEYLLNQKLPFCLVKIKEAAEEGKSSTRILLFWFVEQRHRAEVSQRYDDCVFISKELENIGFNVRTTVTSNMGDGEVSPYGYYNDYCLRVTW